MQMSGSERRAQIERVRAQQQAGWMEQRRLQQDREHVMGQQAPAPSPSPSRPALAPGPAPGGVHDAAVLDRLTERISDRLRTEIRVELEREASELEHTRAVNRSEAEDSVERYLTGEMASQTCSICMELMVSPRTPMMLFPCGHTFCSVCIETNQAKGGAGKNKCPYCRATIESKAPNLTLQNLVQSFVEKQSALDAGQYRDVYDTSAKETKPGAVSAAAAPPTAATSAVDPDLGVGVSEAARHRRDFRLHSMRWKILRNERSDIAMEMEVMDGKDAATMMVLERLESEEQRIGERMAALHAELELVRNHKADQLARVEDGKGERDLCHQRISLIDEALLPLTRERDKLKLLLEAGGEYVTDED